MVVVVAQQGEELCLSQQGAHRNGEFSLVCSIPGSSPPNSPGTFWLRRNATLTHTYARAPTFVRTKMDNRHGAQSPFGEGTWNPQVERRQLVELSTARLGRSTGGRSQTRSGGPFREVQVQTKGEAVAKLNCEFTASYHPLVRAFGKQSERNAAK
ncbi:hypothetical protein BJV74DRAFT_988016 [Russula compacta]|nr:hypothetical protein BJV74DRAFT_988016 [Russula compacta]